MLEEVFARVEAKRDDIVRLTQELIQIPTINPPGEAYTPCAEYIGRRMARRGFQVEYVRGEGSPGDSARYPRTNVVTRFEGRNPGPCVHFNSHMDVVEVGKGWTVDPFAGVVKDGKVYGRGACDMKGGLAASIIAVETIIECVGNLNGALEISGTVDEESGGLGGVAYLAQKGYFSPPRVDHVIIPEPLQKDRICLGHRGVWWGEVETHGEIAHGSMPFLGDCAVRHMGAFMEKLEKRLYPLLEQKQTEMPVTPKEARRSTLNINSIHGGQEPSGEGLPSPCVPDSCRLVLDRRFLIEESLDEVRGEVVSLLEDLCRERENFRYSLKDLLEVLPTMTEKDAPVVRAVAEGIETVLAKPAEYIISPGSYDQKHIARLGHLYDCIAYGPGILEMAHRPDEFVGIDDMIDSAKVMAQAALVLTGTIAR
ncbi:acetylornithine deacetylase/succinyl-diaminopimelate desuccinylase family protein [Rhodobacteraceae bacterium RKSG542]|uniref:acetylornithine deacetylase/succinyl-diaminopimelate desuccinylase family protein n=1 Tax=Pseudovibrio flavus TaxID=2529854 RepID=UPI0012BD1843|nr:acetylornithine deacetylase/succinyl-diaminopimelate desuccinylase family protein [Pseudovibrio flavus]MTI17003.1 acetylornithine deacetylase/succinyl-diaminopimelate desuccinylase family protein [Pseudovibrio flavus]